MTNLHSLELETKRRHQELLKEAERARLARSLEENRANGTGTAYGHAIVIGGSIAGLAAAPVLAGHFGRVTIVERDHLPETPEFRRGAPQARHAHTLQHRGQEILEELFPGLTNELAAGGAITLDPGADLRIFTAGTWHVPRRGNGLASLAFSHPLLEAALRRRVAGLPGVEFLQGQEAVGLLVDESGERVTGVRLRGRGESNADQTELAADLVVDASGRGSRAAGWLAGLGFTPPRETTVDALTGYASRVFRVPAGHGDARKAAYIKPTPPTGTRGGMIVPIEGDRWHVSLVGMDGDYPPTDEADFLEFARSLPAPHLYQAIKDAEPLTNVSGYRRNQTRMLHYEDLPRYLEGLLVSGDAVHSLNPVYALGVTAAAVGAVALENSLKAQRRRAADADLAGLARRFQTELARRIAPMWSMATHEDRRWPATQSAGDVSPAPGWTPKAAML